MQRIKDLVAMKSTNPSQMNLTLLDSNIQGPCKISLDLSR